MRKEISFNGQTLTLFGVYMSGSGAFNAPVKAYEPIAIPGRNGDVLGPEKRMENVEVVYPCFIYRNFRDFGENIAKLREFLLSVDGYAELMDDYNPDEYRLAYYAGGLEAEPTTTLDAGRFDLRFMCKPQRFLLDGRSAKRFNSSGTLLNPTRFPSLPLITIYGKGRLMINSDVITITAANTPYTVIDCELMTAYYGTQDKNRFVQLSGNDFPTLKPGQNTISFDGSITEVAITPRWFVV